MTALRNLITNPSFETDLAGWGQSANATLAREYVDALGEYVLKWTSAATTLSRVRTFPPLTPATPGVSYAVRAQLAAVTRDQPMELQVIWFNAASSPVGTVTVRAFTGTAALAEMSGVVVAPANAAYISLAGAALVPAVNDVFRIDKASIVESATLTPYFDGDTLTGAYAYSWDGTPHASTSTRTPVREALEALPAGESVLAMYDGLPEHYRSADEAAGDYPLLRFLAGIGLELGAVDVLRERIDYVTVPDGGELGDTSDLADPTTADATWLPWLAQLVGVNLAPGLPEDARRDAVEFASAGWRAGTKSSVADAARSVLTGTKFAVVYDHSTAAVRGTASVWDVLIVTRPTETPDPAAVLTAVVARGAKPAGVVLHHLAYEAEFATVETTYPTWDSIDSAGSWNKIQEAGL